MDPISVSASILGLLGAAAKISEILTQFVKGVKDAPKLAQRTLTEVEDLNLCFQQLQRFVNSEAFRKRSRTAMVMVDQLVVILTHAVMTFSELEDAVEGLKPRTSIISGRFRWIAKEHTISLLLQRLHASKTSLNLLLTTLTCARLEEAQEATESLTRHVHDVLITNQSLCRRLENADLCTESKRHSAPSAPEHKILTGEGASTGRSRRDTWTSSTTTAVEERPEYGFSFERDLRSSRVYSRVLRTLSRKSDPDNSSLFSSTGGSMGSSFLSGMSLADVSNISLISFPIPLQSMTNNARCIAPRAIKPLPDYGRKTLLNLPRPIGRIALLGISNAGKSTVLKQLQSLQGTKATLAEAEEACRVIYAQLIEVFQRASQRDKDSLPDFLSQVSRVNYEMYSRRTMPSDYLIQYSHLLVASPSDVEKTYALLMLQEYWKSTHVRWAIESAKWPCVPNNIS
ncbi:MAG: hypothetical protein Q9166_002560 [cf. Caloplaca sp. 2 TL-2023]